jgi:hypothetical protein
MPRKRNKANTVYGQYVGIARDALSSSRFMQLRPGSVKLLLDMLADWNGFNNGNLGASITTLKGRGWRSTSTLAICLEELLNAGFIARTIMPGRRRQAFFAVTWADLGEAKDLKRQLDPELRRSFQRSAYKANGYQPPFEVKAPFKNHRGSGRASESGFSGSKSESVASETIRNSNLASRVNGKQIRISNQFSTIPNLTDSNTEHPYIEPVQGGVLGGALHGESN